MVESDRRRWFSAKKFDSLAVTARMCSTIFPESILKCKEKCNRSSSIFLCAGKRAFQRNNCAYVFA